MNRRELPADWRWAKIGEIAIVNKRNPRLRELPDDLPVTFLPMAGVDAVSGTVANPEIRNLGEVRKGFTAFEPGDVLFAKITPSMENGKAAIAKSLVNDIGLGSTEFHVISAGPCVLPEWIFHFVRQESFRADAKANFSGTAGQLRVPTDFISSYAIPVPPLPEQKRIVELIETQFTRLDAAEAALKRVQANLRRYRTAVLKAACEGRLVPTEAELAQAEGRTYEPAAALLERILAERRAQWQAEHPGKKYKEPVGPDVNALPELPEGWCWATVEQVAEHRLGKMLDQIKNKGTPRPYLRNINVRWYSFDLTDVQMMRVLEDELADISVREGDLVVCEGGEPGRCAVWTRTDTQMVLQKALHRVRMNANVFPWFVAIKLRADAGGGKLERYFTGSTIKHFTGESLAKYAIPLAPRIEQQRIIDEVHRLLSVIKTMEIEATTVSARGDLLRQSILQRAFSGQLVEHDLPQSSHQHLSPELS